MLHGAVLRAVEEGIAGNWGFGRGFFFWFFRIFFFFVCGLGGKEGGKESKEGGRRKGKLENVDDDEA